MSYLEQTVNADLNFWVNRLSLNDAKCGLTVVEIVYRKSMMAACLLFCGVLLMCDVR